MIGRLNGKLVEKQPPNIVIECFGVGYEVEAPMSTICDLPELGSVVTLLTHHHIRDDANLLFGFLKSRTSWHSVMPIRCPAEISRRALIITYHIKPQVQQTVLYRGVNYVYRHIEDARFEASKPDA